MSLACLLLIYSKIKIEYICPKCDKRCLMNFKWIGRGIPRKYRPRCKGGL
jgi:hypothetical protein